MKPYGIGPKDEVTAKFRGAHGARSARHRERARARRALREEIESAVVQRQVTTLPTLSPKARLVLAWLEAQGVVRLLEWLARIPAPLRHELYGHGCCRLVRANDSGIGEATVEVVETEYSYLIPPQRLQLAALGRSR